MSQSSNTFLTDIDSPFRFDHNCDLVTADNERAIYNNLKAITYLRKGGFFLNITIGSNAAMEVFEPNDVVTQELITSSIIDAVSEQEPRVVLNPNIRYITEDGNVVRAAITYKYKNTNEEWKTTFVDLT